MILLYHIHYPYYQLTIPKMRFPHSCPRPFQHSVKGKKSPKKCHDHNGQPFRRCPLFQNTPKPYSLRAFLSIVSFLFASFSLM